jgi:hypothetical protein
MEIQLQYRPLDNYKLTKFLLISILEEIQEFYLEVKLFYPWILIGLLWICLNIDFTGEAVYCVSVNKRHPLITEYLEKRDSFFAYVLKYIYEENEEYCSLYRLFKYIEMINFLLEKIKEKNPTHLNLDTSHFVFDDYFVSGLYHCYTYLLSFCSNENIQEKIPNISKEAKFFRGFTNNVTINQILDFNTIIMKDMLEILFSKDTVKEKFALILSLITLDKEVADYDCEKLFQTNIGDLTLSEGFKKFTYFDLQMLNVFVRLTLNHLFRHYLCLPTSIDLKPGSFWEMSIVDPLKIFGPEGNLEITESKFSFNARFNVLETLLRLYLEKRFQMDLIVDVLCNYYHFMRFPITKQNTVEESLQLRELLENIQDMSTTELFRMLEDYGFNSTELYKTLVLQMTDALIDL